jgi:hypothetical protein
MDKKSNITFGPGQWILDVSYNDKEGSNKSERKFAKVVKM